MRSRNQGILYVLPALAVVAIVMLYPLLYTVTVGFCDYTLFMDAPKFAGFDQYAKLFSDKYFIGSIWNTIVWTFSCVALQFLLGFALAMILHQPFVKYKTIIRILLMVPWVLPSIIGSSVWKWMYNADYGIINYILQSVGIIEQNQTWLSNPDIAMMSVVIVNVWKMFPFILLMIEASLQGVSTQLKEAAVIDGAGKLSIFRNVTWPSIAPACYSVLLLMIIWTLNSFTFIYNLTGGGPAHATEVMAMFIHKEAFVNYDFGLASAASTVLFMLSMIISLIYIAFTKKGEE